jgi:hypothetical protein
MEQWQLSIAVNGATISYRTVPHRQDPWMAMIACRYFDIGVTFAAP